MQETFKNVSISEEIQNELINSFHDIIAKYQKKTTDETPLLNVSKEDFDEFIAIYSNITTLIV